MNMMLTARERQILRAIVHEHIHSAQPVGSRLLWGRYGLGISPATIRGVMVALTEAGYLSQPHTSAGRVPTDQAYRLFLEGAENSTPSVGEQEKLTQRLAKAPRNTAPQILAAQLAEVAGAAGFYLDASGPRFTNLTNVFGQPEFSDPRVASYLAQLLDQATEWIPKLASETGRVAIRIGEENQDFRARQVSVMVMKLNDQEYVGIIGPTRLPYHKATALFEYGYEQLEKQHG